MSQPQPFMFATSDGKFSYPISKPIATVYGLEKLYKLCLSNSAPEYLAAASALEAFLKRCVVDQAYLNTKDGDVRASSDTSHYNKKRCVCVVVLGPGKTQYDPSGQNRINSDHKTWGWGGTEDLMPHLKIYNKLAKQNDITFFSSNIERIAVWREQMKNGELKIRTPEAEMDFGRSACFAIYCLDYGKYVARDGYINSTLAGAGLFETEFAAQKYIDRDTKKSGRKFAIVPLHVRVAHVPMQALDAKSATLFQEAVAVMNKEDIEQSLKDCTIEQLEDRLAQLGQTPQPASKPKRM